MGVYIKGITVEMFRNAPLESIEELLLAGDFVDIKEPHGRLIDADALKTAIHETEFYYDSTEEKCKRHDIGRLVHTLIDGIIDKSPTLIDAEEG